jgi:Asp-tRNA(Asn)/Glu-tRNA(Gln) amidotransferase C subunit
MTHEKITNKLLIPLWEGIDSSYKEKYKRNIWQQFENNLRVAAYTSKLNYFLSKFFKLAPCVIHESYLNELNAILNSGEDEEILEILRAETTYLVLLVRTERQEVREDYRRRQDEKKEVIKNSMESMFKDKEETENK